MDKNILITEKPSVAMQMAKALKINTTRKDGYLESDEWIVTWCVGHLVTMCYPEKYDEKLKFWRLDTLPFIPKEWKYEVIPNVQKQFNIIKELLNREDVKTIYVSTDSGREGEYIYRLVDQMIHPEGKTKKRVWIDSQTEEEVIKGIKNAKDLSEYDSLSDAAYLRAKEDYLIGINFSRLLSIIYGRKLAQEINEDKASISVGRVMTCVLGMVVSREREIRNFVKTKYYKIIGKFGDKKSNFEAEWKVTEDSKLYNSNKLYNDNGFKKLDDAKAFILSLKDKEAIVKEVKKSKQKENPPLLFNLAEIQNECTKRFKIKPDETLEIIQNLYENKLVTYPRTDARVLSTAVAKEISKNGIETKDGLIELLDFLKNNNYRMAVASSSEEKNIRTYLDKLNVIKDFEVILSGEMVTKGKPAPEIYLKSAELLNLPIEECIGLEDSINGVLSICRAGMRAVMIPDLQEPTKEVEDMLYAKLNSLTDVIDLLKNEHK